MSTWIVGEMLYKFPSSKASGAGIVFLNQSTCFGVKKSFDSRVYYWDIIGDEKDDRCWRLSHGGV